MSGNSTVRGDITGRVHGILNPGVSPTFTGDGVSRVVRIGAGSYTLVLVQAVNPNRVTLALSMHALGHCARTIDSDGQSIQIDTTNPAGTATDIAVDVYSSELTHE